MDKFLSLTNSFLSNNEEGIQNRKYEFFSSKKRHKL